MELLEKFLKKELHIDNNIHMLDLFKNYNDLLLEWNKKINLISRKTDSIENHLLNSIFFLSKYPFDGNEQIIDIGTGGGFPGIPLKIIYPNLNVTLLDSIQKKTTVLQDISNSLNLDIDIVTGRAEEVSKKTEFSQKYDIVISKAVSNLGNLFNWGEAFMNADGRMLCIKGGEITGELKELKSTYSFVKTETIDYSFPSEYNIEDKKVVIISK